MKFFYVLIWFIGQVQQPVDPSSFYAQFYRSGADSDVHASPFPAHVAAARYNGNVAVLPSQTSQSLTEVCMLTSLIVKESQILGLVFLLMHPCVNQQCMLIWKLGLQ